MAPLPELNRKPPDRDDKSITDDIQKLEVENTSGSGHAAQSDQASEREKNKAVGTLNEGQLRYLLEETISYKSPKDREGKSSLFQNLLAQAEADEECKNSKLMAGKTYLPPSKKRSKGRECGGSLQNLHALGMDGCRDGCKGARRRSGRSNETLVSARQREGGSLPSNVNSDDSVDIVDTYNYTSSASLQVNETKIEDCSTVPVPGLNGAELSISNNTSINNGDLEVSFNETKSSQCIGQGEVVFSPQQQHISMLSIPPSQFNTTSDDQNQLDSSEHRKLYSNRLRHKKAVTLPRSDMALVPAIIGGPDEEGEAKSSGLGIPLSSPKWCSYSSCTVFDFLDLTGARYVATSKDSFEPKAKSCDENGNALGSNCYQDRKKQRRIKTKNDRNSRDFMSNDVEGFRGGSDIDSLMEYIENRTDGSKSSKTRSNNVKIRAKDDESRTVKRRKEKLQRCNSLEEISKTKLEDLTEEGSNEKINGSSLALTKRQMTVDDAEVGMKSAWNNLNSSTTISKNYASKIDKTSQELQQESDFLTVTKKQRKKKRRRAEMRTGSEGVGSKPVFRAHDRTLQYRHQPSIAPQPRRKSASSVPPSDKSDSSDLDSVHSLPVSSTTSRARLGKSSVSGGSTPQASYADIARSVCSSDRGKCLSDCDCANNKPLLPSFKRDATTETTCDISASLLNEDYPPLVVKPIDLMLDNFVKSTECVTHRDDKISEEKVILKTVPLKIVIPMDLIDVPDSYNKNLVVTNSNSKRPPVILVNEPITKPQIVHELKFGFEVNQQLLESDNAVSNMDNVIPPASSSPPRPSQFTSTREPSLDKMIDYLIAAWESTLRDVEANRARFYDGQ